MKRTIALIGAPSSAGAHWPGQEKAPHCLREAGLTRSLHDSGMQVVDLGDLPTVRFRPDKEHRRHQNLEMVVQVARSVAERVDSALNERATPLVIGGDCTVGLGVVAAFQRHHHDFGLLYFDGHVDLNTPATSRSGILDSMVVAHLIGEAGTASELSHVGERFPLMEAYKIVLFGYNPLEMNATERDVLALRRLRQYPLFDVRTRTAGAASEAVAFLEAQGDRFLVHFDVDVIDFTDLPVANVAQFGPGLSFQDAMECLAVFASSPKFGGLTLTEFNPDHGRPEDARLFVDSLAKALAGCL